MKLLKDDPFILRKVFLAVSIMTLVIYAIAMVFSLCGSSYFILNYQNAHMDMIESWLRDHKIYSLATYVFSAIEFYIILSFILKKRASVVYPLVFYSVAVFNAFLFPNTPSFVYTIYPLLYYIFVPMIDQAISAKKTQVKFSWKLYGKQMIKLAISIGVVAVLQAMILIIKAGYFDGKNHILPLSGFFIYSIEYDIALLVILYTVSLYFNREKGDSKPWVTYQDHGSSSQTSMMPSPKSKSKKPLTKTQKNKLVWFYIKLYAIQLGTFLLVMILPFLLGKVLEFLVMYLAFAIVRYILGFKYSLHFKKESLCALVGVIVFGILSLAVPFFYVVIIIAISLGTALAVLLHLSYKYKGMWLFSAAAKPDKFAELYVLFDGNLDHKYVFRMCKYRGLAEEDAHIVADFTDGNKKSYLATKYNYSEKTIERKINESIDVLKSKS